MGRADGGPGPCRLGGFTEHYVLPVVYPTGLTRPTQVALAVLVCFANVLVYSFIWFSRRQA
jgi:uncharacterized membrane protein